ncbi:tRNA-dihydrouridine(20) synthase isoform X1 [Hibiscus syriacus]|uniref:tRNA-dihydrouridine(20) synthase isoform X1 n=1 Tax=Hibiscus syriacus TaxID=106335 RepID=A0A6A2XE75_HIBSY|nr:tRNA-dihydrouridine(20) synthase isoform X1 [Hibiscus syriacus]
MESLRILRYAIAQLSFLLLLSLYFTEGRLKDLEFRRKTKYGDEYDCVGHYEQPALRHSLLKNHKIQMSPSFDPQRDYTNPTGNGTPDNSIDVVLMDPCPYGTVPIRRRSTAELLRAKALFRRQFPSLHKTADNFSPGFAFAGIVTRDNHATVYYGAGGMVNVDLYKDNTTRLYTLWGQRQNGQMIGCYNTYCPGFVQTDPSIALDMTLGPISVVRGPQYYIKLSVTQEKSTRYWRLKYGNDDRPVGYWPGSLFTNLGNGAPGLRWGGMVSSSTGQVPPMGNGDNGEIHSSHFRQLVLQYEAGTSLNGSVDVPLDVLQTRCYKCGNNYYKGEFWGYSFYFGGDGGDATQCSSNFAFSRVIEELTRQFCNLLGQSNDSPLSVTIAAGIQALPPLLKCITCMAGKQHEWQSMKQLPVPVKLGKEFQFHSIFVCPVSKEQSTDDNPPMLMSCGHVLCQQSINKMSKNGSKSFKCPYCSTDINLTQCRQLIF